MLAPSTTSTSLPSSCSITIQLRHVNSYILRLGLFQQTLLINLTLLCGKKAIGDCTQMDE